MIKFISLEGMGDQVKEMGKMEGGNDYVCFMRGSGDCKGEVMRFPIGTSFVDICVRHSIFLMRAFDEAGF